MHQPVLCGASLVVQLVKNLPAMQETWVQSLGWENLLEEGTAIHFSILDWRMPIGGGILYAPPIEEPGGLQSKGSQLRD